MTEESNVTKKVLIAEDDQASAELLKRIVEKAGHNADIASNGKKAYEAFMQSRYDALLTDWMMPQMDGIELIRKVRENISDPPVIIVITALSSYEARNHALTSGADDFIAKPYRPNDIIEKLKDLFSRIDQKPPEHAAIPSIVTERNPPFTGICIAASSGGPQTLMSIIRSIPVLKKAALFIVQHGPPWALKDMADYWNKFCSMEIMLGSDGQNVEPGKIYLAPGKYHMTIEPGSYNVQLNDDPPENFIKPAADPLFRSVARSFGRFSIAVVLSGMGCDGTLGSQYISAASGIVIAQDPKTAIVKFMPMTVIETVPGTVIVPLQDIPNILVRYTAEQSKYLSIDS